MRPIIGAGGLGIGERIRYREVDSAWADIQADLNSADYDGVALEYGAWTVALNQNLNIPDGKILMGYRWPGDLSAQTSIQVLGANQITVDGRLESLNIEFDAARTADLLVGAEGRGKNLRVYTSDTAFHNYFAFSGVWKEIDTFEVIDVKGVDVAAALADPSTGPMRIRNFYIDSTNDANARGIYLHGGAENVIIEEGYITAYWGIYNDGGDYVTLDTISFTDCDDYAIRNLNAPEFCTYRTLRFFNVAVAGAGISGAVNETTMDDLKFYGNDVTAALPFNFGGSHNTVSNVYAERSSQILFGGFDYSTATNIVCGSTTLVTRYGIEFNGVHQSEFSNCVAHGRTNSGFYIALNSQAYRCNFSNMTAYDNGGHGFYLRDGRYNGWSNLVAYGNTLSGIRIDYSTYDNWTNLTAYNNGSRGIECGYLTESTMSQLVAKNNTSHGFAGGGAAVRSSFSDIIALNNGGFDVYCLNIAAYASRCWIRQINAGTIDDGGGTGLLGTNWYTGKDRGGFTLDAAEVVNCPVGGGGFGPYYPLAADVGNTSGTTLFGSEQEFVEDADGHIQYVGRYRKVFDVTITFSAISSVDNDTISGAISHNNAAVAASENAHTAALTGTYVTMTARHRLTLNTNDTIGLKVGSVNAGANITVHRINCQALEAEDM